MKQCIVRLICLAFCILWGSCAFAAPDNVQEARARVMSAAGCMASYEDRNGHLVESYLTAAGWEIDRYATVDGKVSAEFLIAKKTDDGKERFLLAVAGTNDVRDVRLDLKMKQVPYGGSTIEEFGEVASRPLDKENDGEMRVHKGFDKLALHLLTVEVNTDKGLRSLVDILRENRDAHVYLTGHSLGGAAVTVLGARLSDLGILTEQIHIMTFGAPAVGNESFARRYEHLPLTRITLKGDPIVIALQKVAGGYEQFGTEKKLDEREKSILGLSAANHNITEYFDVVLKDYYDTLGMRKGDVPYEASERASKEGEAKVYVTPIRAELDMKFDKDRAYMKMAFADTVRLHTDGFVLAESRDNAEENARKAGCRYLVTSTVRDIPMREEYNKHYIVYTHTIYDLKENTIVGIHSHSTDTRRMTAMESFIRSAFYAWEDVKAIL